MRERAVEYHTLLLIGAGGMSLLAISNSFVTVFVALELLSICLYILVAMDSDELLSLEGGLKYLIVGAVGAALLLYGAAMVYGATGSFEFDRIAAGARGHGDDALLLGGMALVIAGLAFKANAAPLHMWTPDAYEGAPTPVTTFMSAATKVAALIVIMRVLVTAFPTIRHLEERLAGLAIASFAIGNLAALRQTNVKRMLAYSTVGHTGFLLTAVAADARGRRGAALLPRRLRGHERRRVHDRGDPRARDRTAGRDPRLHRVRLHAAGALDRDDDLHALAGRHPAHRRASWRSSGSSARRSRATSRTWRSPA